MINDTIELLPDPNLNNGHGITQVLEYEYEPEMEDTYRSSLLKTFKKTLDDGFFPFIIMDTINDRVKHFDQFWSAAKTKGFEVGRDVVCYFPLKGNCLCSTIREYCFVCMFWKKKHSLPQSLTQVGALNWFFCSHNKRAKRYSPVLENSRE